MITETFTYVDDVSECPLDEPFLHPVRVYCAVSPLSLLLEQAFLTLMQALFTAG